MMNASVFDYDQDGLETVDSYMEKTHMEDALYPHEIITDSDDASIDKLLRKSSMQLTDDVLNTIEKKRTLDEFAEDDALTDEELLEVFGSDDSKEPEILTDNDISFPDLQIVFPKAA